MKHHQLTIMVVVISVLVFFATMQITNTGMIVNDVDSCTSKQTPDAYSKGKAVVIKNNERKTYEDTCMNDATTIKYYCSGNEIRKQKIFCGFNEYCFDGVCRKGKLEEPKKVYPSREQFLARYWDESPIKPRN